MMIFHFFPIRLWSEFPCKCKIYILPFVFLDLWILSEMAETWVVRGELETLRACKSKPSSQPASERANKRRIKCTRLMWIRSDKSSVRRATNTHTFANFLGFYVCCTCINWARYSALAQSVRSYEQDDDGKREHETECMRVFIGWLMVCGVHPVPNGKYPVSNEWLKNKRT